MKRDTVLKILCATACFAGVGSAWPQTGDSTIASLKSVVGSVLVSKETGLSSGNDDVRLGTGTRVITTSNSEAVVKYDDGCEVRLKPNQRFEVDKGKTCAVLISQVESIVTEAQGTAGMGVLAGGSAGELLPALAVGAGGIVAIQRWRQGQSVSPD